MRLDVAAPLLSAVCPNTERGLLLQPGGAVSTAAPHPPARAAVNFKPRPDDVFLVTPPKASYSAPGLPLPTLHATLVPGEVSPAASATCSSCPAPVRRPTGLARM